MTFPRWLKEPILARLYRRVGITYNPHGISFELGKHLTPGVPLTFIDAGARTGEFTRSLRALCGGVRQALLVEPQPAHAAALRQEFAASEYRVEECALSDHAGMMELEINEFDAATSILPTLAPGGRELAGLDMRVRERVPCALQTLDTLIARWQPAGPVDLLKIDVQGAERLLLAGARELLRTTRLIWCEVSFRPLYEGSAAFQEIYELASASGFHLLELAPGYRGPQGELLQADALFGRSLNA